jgi:arabinogalactan endo-1,4-beta-galactosidase
MKMFTTFCLPALFLLLLHLDGGCSELSFHLDLHGMETTGRFNPETDLPLVRGSFNNWEGNANLLHSDEEGLYSCITVLPPGEYQYKFLIEKEECGDIWESIPNRYISLTTEDLHLPTAYFDNDSTTHMSPRPVELYFSVDLSLQVLTGVFNPAQDAVSIRGDHEALGCWNAGPHLLPLPQNRWGVWVPFNQLSDNPEAYKFVIEIDGSTDDLIWESGDNRSFINDGNEVDILPPPHGNGFFEKVLNTACFDRGNCNTTSDPGSGADLSFLPQMEHLGADFKVGGHSSDALDIFHEAEFSMVRLRLWHTPQEGWHGLDSTLAFAERLRDKGFQLTLDLHYSDTWADPGHQEKPEAWRGIDFSALEDSVYAYTNEVILAFLDRNVLPDYVQLGNEIDPGLLWNDGRVGGQYDTPQQWSNLGNLLKSARSGLLDSLSAEQAPRVMIHLSSGGSHATCRWFLDHLLQEDLDFDVIGLSYYPWWHGDLAALEHNLRELSNRYTREIQIVETAYPWTLGSNDDQNNFVWSTDQLLPQFDASPQGQRSFMQALQTIVASLPSGYGSFIQYWAPDFLTLENGPGNPWENLTLFDFSGEALPALYYKQQHSETPQLQISLLGTDGLRLEWDHCVGAFQYSIQSSPHPWGPWTDEALVTGSPWLTTRYSETKFYRVKAIR